MAITQDQYNNPDSFVGEDCAWIKISVTLDSPPPGAWGRISIHNNASVRAVTSDLTEYRHGDKLPFDSDGPPLELIIYTVSTIYGAIEFIPDNESYNYNVNVLAGRFTAYPFGFYCGKTPTLNIYNYGSVDFSKVTSLSGITRGFNNTDLKRIKFKTPLDDLEVCENIVDVPNDTFAFVDDGLDLSKWKLSHIPYAPTNFGKGSDLATDASLQPKWGASCEPPELVFAVQRGAETFSCSSEDLNTKLQDGDLVIVQRSDTCYAYTINLTDLRK